MKESPEKKEASENYQSSFLRDIFNKPNDALEFKIKKWNPKSVSYTHLTLPTIYSV